MKVIVAERGSRPSALTKARIIAPQAVIFLGKQLEDKAFADIANVVIDWDGDLAWNGPEPMPEDMRQPVVIVEVHKYYPQINRWLRVDYKLDLEDFFGQDNATSDDLFEVIENLERKVREEEAKRIT